MYKEDFLAIGGHDELFAPQSREDSDLFNRFHLAGYKFIQTWRGLVYHFTSRGSRFNPMSGGDIGQNSPEWTEQNRKSERNFIRKWGTMVQHDQMMKPVVSHKYDKYAPILSMNSRNDFCDIPIPTWEDWDRVRSISEGVFFPKACRDYRFKFDTKWENKKKDAILVSKPFNLNNIKTHPDYKPALKYYDVAMVKLDEPVKLHDPIHIGPYINTISLPEVGIIFN